MDSVLIGAQLLLAAVFALAGVAKLLDLPGSRRAIGEFGVPARAAAVAGVLLPVAEVATAVALVLEPAARWGGVAALVLLGTFVAGIASAMRRGKAPDCHCFGQVHSAPAGRSTLIRNALLAVPAALVVAEGPGPAIDTWVADRTAGELLAIVAGLGVVALAVTYTGRWLRKRRHEESRRRALEALNTAPEREPEGLPPGTPAPGFQLADITGGSNTLESLLSHGRPVLLAFMDYSCSPCRALMPAIARWQGGLADKLTIAVVTRDHVEQRPGWEETGITNVLLEKSDEVTKAYRLEGTPSAVGIWPDGTIATAPAGGKHMPEVLVRVLLHGAPRTQAAAAPKPTLPLVRVAPATQS